MTIDPRDIECICVRPVRLSPSDRPDLPVAMLSGGDWGHGNAGVTLAFGSLRLVMRAAAFGQVLADIGPVGDDTSAEVRESLSSLLSAYDALTRR